VVRLSDACFFLLEKYGCFSDYSFCHFPAIDGDYLLITIDVLWCNGAYIDELNFSMALHRISKHS